jgi:replicative DNA helicase
MIDTTIADAELGVLGAVLATNGRCLDDIALVGDDFYEPVRGEIFDGMRAMHDRGNSVDIITLSDQHPKHVAFISSLIVHTHFAPAVDLYAEIVAKNALRRRLATVGATLAGMDPELSATEMTDRARALVDEAVGQQKSQVRFVRHVLPDVIEAMTSGSTFVTSPWPSLDAYIGGFRPGTVVVIAARPGVGKTVLAAQIAARLAEEGLVSFSSLEMSDVELVSRLISERLQIMVGKIKDARMTDLDWNVLAGGREKLEALNIAIDDRAGVTPGDIRTFARTVSRHGRLSGVVVDYLQLMTSRSKQDRHVQVSEFSRQLKILAKDMHVPVIALSQLNRESESRANKKPMLADLRESGAIEQDADVVILLRKEGEYPNQSLVLDIAKNRHGQTGEINLAWQGEFSRAVEWRS